MEIILARLKDIIKFDMRDEMEAIDILEDMKTPLLAEGSGFSHQIKRMFTFPFSN